MIDTKDKAQVERAYKYFDTDLTQDFYGSTEFQNAWDRFSVRIDAYHRRHATNAPKWRSKLYMASFYIACKALEAQFKASHSSDPFIFVSSSDNSDLDPEAAEKALVTHSNLNYDLRKSRFKSNLFDIFYYVNIFGTVVCREYFRSIQSSKTTNRRNVDVYNIDQGVKSEETFSREEYTATDVIHPLNFAHDKTKKGFHDSEWASVRFPLSIAEIYKMEDNPFYYQPGVKKLIEKIDEGGMDTYNTSQQEFYSERGGKGDKGEKNKIIVNEISSPCRIKGNRRDGTLYYGLWNRDINDFLCLKPSPFQQHHYWKVATNLPPDGPYGICPNDPLLPINAWENYTVNQYVDWMTTALKFMYEVQPDNIVGGMLTLIQGLPNGLVPIEKETPIGQSMKGLGLNQNSIPAVKDVLSMIAQAKQEYGASSNLRGREGGSNADTATGISLLSEREDTLIEAMMDDIDMGLEDGMFIKVRNQVDFFTEPRIADIRDGETMRRVQHYPYELSGVDYTFNIKREVGDIKAGKHMSFLKLIMGVDQALAQKGAGIPPKVLIDTVEEIGRGVGVDNIDRIGKELREGLQQMPVQVPGQMPGQPQPQPAASGGLAAAL